LNNCGAVLIEIEMNEVFFVESGLKKSKKSLTTKKLKEEKRKNFLNS
jgi:hypothetical protein